MGDAALLNQAIFMDLEEHGPEGALKKQTGSIEFSKIWLTIKNKHSKSFEYFLKSGSSFSSRPVPQRPEGHVKIVSDYPAEYIEEQNRILAQAD